MSTSASTCRTTASTQENRPLSSHQEELQFFDFIPNDIPPITGVSINAATNWAGFATSTFPRVSNHVEAVFVELAELSGLAGQQILLDLTFVPEPAAAALLAAASTALLAAHRRRRPGNA
jgi:hypothetical protein